MVGIGASHPNGTFRAAKHTQTTERNFLPVEGPFTLFWHAPGFMEPHIDFEGEPGAASPAPGPNGTPLCGTCSARSAVDVGQCLDCLGSRKLIVKLCQLLQEEDPRVGQEEVQRRCRQACSFITGVYKTADNHWQFAVHGRRARLHGIHAAASTLKSLTSEPQSTAVSYPEYPEPLKARPSWSSTGAAPSSPYAAAGTTRRIPSTSKAQAHRHWAAKRDQVHTAQAHLSCCIKDRDTLQHKLITLEQQLSVFSEKCQEAELQLNVAQQEEAAAAHALEFQRDRDHNVDHNGHAAHGIMHHGSMP